VRDNEGQIEIVVVVAAVGHRVGVASKGARRGRKQASETGRVVRKKTLSASSGELAGKCLVRRECVEKRRFVAGIK
jgi:hypothetical protein